MEVRACDCKDAARLVGVACDGLKQNLVVDEFDVELDGFCRHSIRRIVVFEIDGLSASFGKFGSLDDLFDRGSLIIDENRPVARYGDIQGGPFPRD